MTAVKETPAERVQRRNADYHATFTTDTGKRVLAHIERECFVDRTTLTAPAHGTSVDPIRTWVAEGMRVAALRIRSYVTQGARPAPSPLPRRATSATAEPKEGEA